MNRRALNRVGCPKSGQWVYSIGARAARVLWLVMALVSCIAPAGAAQTNGPTDFQGFRPGDVVRVKAKKPLIEFARARFQSETISNIVVISKGDRYCLEKKEVTLSLPEGQTVRGINATNGPTQSATGAAALQPGLSLSGTNSAQATPPNDMEAIEASILGNYKGEPGYDAAVKYYRETMKGLQSGEVSLDDVVAKAEETLKKVDEYQPERAKDPRFEEQIRQLREFVQRAHSGERIVTRPETIP